MTGGTEPTRERVLLAGVEGDEHTLGLQMVHDQLAAAGYQTIFDTDLSARAAARDGRRASRRTCSCSARPRRRQRRSRRGRAARAARAATPTCRSCSAARRSAAACRASAAACGCSSASTSPSKRSKSCSPLAHAAHRPRPYRFRAHEPSRAIVTGGAGFIGSHVVDALLADGYRGDGHRRPLRGRRRARRRRGASCASWTSSTPPALRGGRRRGQARARSSISPRRRASSPRSRTPRATARSTCRAR